MTTNEKLFTQDELAARWSMASNTLRKWRWEGKGPKYVKLGSRVLYRESDILAYEEANIKSSTSEY
jgi:predicted DNA-binding transcriptional regulator AlpA